MAKLTFEDLSGTTPAMLWPEEFAKMADLVKNDLIGFVKGTLDRRRDPAELIISRIIPLEQGPAELTRGVVVRLHKGLHQTEHLERLLRAVRIRPGNLDLYLEIVGLEQVRRAVYKAGASLRVRYDDRLIPDLEAAVGPGHVRLLRPARRHRRESMPAAPPPSARRPPPNRAGTPHAAPKPSSMTRRPTTPTTLMMRLDAIVLAHSDSLSEDPFRADRPEDRLGADDRDGGFHNRHQARTWTCQELVPIIRKLSTDSSQKLHTKHPAGLLSSLTCSFKPLTRT